VSGALEPRAAGGDRAWRRILSGLLVEQGLASRDATRRWQEAVRAGALDPDRCADELIESVPGLDADARLGERAARLQRDLVMAPLLRGATGAKRRLRRAARGGAAILVSQAVVVGIYTLLVVAALVLLRYHGVAFDPLFDRLLLR